MGPHRCFLHAEVAAVSLHRGIELSRHLVEFIEDEGEVGTSHFPSRLVNCFRSTARVWKTSATELADRPFDSLAGIRAVPGNRRAVS